MSITNVFLAHTQLYANINEITLHGDLPTYKMQNKIKTFKLLARIGKFYVIINNIITAIVLGVDTKRLK